MTCRRSALIAFFTALYVALAALYYWLPLAAQIWAGAGAILTPVMRIGIELGHGLHVWGPLLRWILLLALFTAAASQSWNMPALGGIEKSLLIWDSEQSGSFSSKILLQVIRWILLVVAVVFLAHLFDLDRWLIFSLVTGVPLILGLSLLLIGLVLTRTNTLQVLESSWRLALTIGFWMSLGAMALSLIALTICALIALLLHPRLLGVSETTMHNIFSASDFSSIFFTQLSSFVNRPPLNVLPLYWFCCVAWGVFLASRAYFGSSEHDESKMVDAVEYFRMQRKRAADRHYGVAVLFVILAVAMFGSFVSVLSALAFGSLVKQQNLRGNSVVLWLRRFNRPETRRAGLGNLLAEASENLAIVLTLRDSSFHASYAMSTLRLKSFMPVLIGALGLLAVTAMATWKQNQALSITIVLASGAALAFLIRRLGYISLSPSAAATHINKLIERIRLRKGLLTDVLVAQCEDASWRSVVTAALSRCDVAVFDIRDPSEHLLWELDVASELIPPDRMVLVHSSQGIPDELEQRLISKFGATWNRRLVAIEYPEIWPSNSALKETRGHLTQQVAHVIGIPTFESS